MSSTNNRGKTSFNNKKRNQNMVLQTILIISVLALGFALGCIYQRKLDNYRFCNGKALQPSCTISDEDIERVVRKVRTDIDDFDIRTFSDDDTNMEQFDRFLSIEEARQLKLSQDEYADTFLQAPKIEDRKPVFVSCEVRDRLDEIVRRIGGKRLSVSGILENMARHHLDLYKDVIGGLYNRQGIIKFN